MKSRFDELLPFYVNGTLGEADRAFVEDYLREHPSAKAEMQWYESLQTKLRSEVPPVSSEVGLERALRRIHTEGPVPKLARRAAPQSFTERARAWLSAILPAPALRPAFVGACAVIVLQGGVIVEMMLGRNDDETQIRAIQASVTDKGPYLKLNFKTDAREADIRMLLVEVQGSLAAGPGQLGDYYVRVPASQVTALADKVKSSPIVDGVSIVDALPGRQ